MHNTSKTDQAGENVQPATGAKKTYHSPELRDYGDLRVVTATGGGTYNPDGGGSLYSS